MTVIIKYDENGSPQYRSAKGIGTTEDERLQARQLDALLKKSINDFKKRVLKGEKKGKADVSLYWDLGDVLRKIFYKSGLIDHSEKSLYWFNAQIYVPNELMAKDRGPNRLHLAYCFRLAGFPKSKVERMKWGEWVYLFDSPGINREQRFDKWLDKKFQGEKNKFTRDDIRFFAQTVNQFLGNTETNDLTDEQLARCYDTAWLVKEKLMASKDKISKKSIKDALKLSIKKNYTKLGAVIDGSKSPEDFSNLVTKEIINKK